MVCRVCNLGHALKPSLHHIGLKNYVVCRVCNLGRVLKHYSHHAGVENIWFVVSNFGTVDARAGHKNELEKSYPRFSFLTHKQYRFLFIFNIFDS